MNIVLISIWDLLGVGAVLCVGIGILSYLLYRKSKEAKQPMTYQISSNGQKKDA